MIITEDHRKAAKQQSVADRQRNKKDAAAIARLQRINELQRLEREANQQFTEQFKKCCKPICSDGRSATPHDLWTLVNVLARLSTDHTQLYKRALKLRYCLKVKGWEPKSVGDVLFLAELTREEAVMPQDDFYTLMTSFEQASEQKPARKKRAPNNSYLARLAADSLRMPYPAANA